MSDPSLAIQKAIVAKLRANVLIETYDIVPSTSDPFPRITVGEGQSIYDPADCYDGTESNIDVHVWSRQVGFPEAKNLASGVRTALNEQLLMLEGHEMSLMQLTQATFLRDPDGITSHVAMQFRVLSQPSD
jgi:hypothetical protein